MIEQANIFSAGEKISQQGEKEEVEVELQTQLQGGRDDSLIGEDLGPHVAGREEELPGHHGGSNF